MKKQNLFRIISLLLFAILVFFSSCTDQEEKLTVQDTKEINEEALTDAYFQDVDDMGGQALNAPTSAEYSGGRTQGIITIKVQDDRFNCNGVVITLERDVTSTISNPKGVIIIDFGAGCSDIRGIVRTGKLHFAYEGKRFMPNSKLVITPENYTVNGVRLEGIRTLVNIQSSTADAPKFNITLSQGKATFSDGTYAERESDINVTWVRAINPLNDSFVIDMTSTAHGTTRSGRTYDMSVVKNLEYKRFCAIAVSGTKKFILDGRKEVIIDYGDGTCDKSVTVTVNGVTRALTIN